MPLPVDAIAEISQGQAGAISRPQLLGLGCSDGQILRAVADGLWQSAGLPGVYVVTTGPISDRTRCWVALLYAGEGATLSHSSAEWVWELRPELPPTVVVTVPVHRRVADQPGVAIRYALHLDTTRHPARQPPVTTVEDTVLDQADRPEVTRSAVIDLVLRVCQRRLTTAARLGSALELRKKIRHRALLQDLLEEVVDGVASTLERRYASDVERAHGLARGRRNAQDGRRGRRRYRDVDYPAYRLVVELDGRAAHPHELREWDDVRDNEVLLDTGRRTLRFGWRSVTVAPCVTAGQVLVLLRRGGWTGTPKRCGPTCTLPVDPAPL
jgi:very-short-patch-repair endonuclease